MRRITWVVLCSCMLAAIALASSPARAGDYYYGDGYYDGGYRSSGYYNDGYSYRPRWHHRSVWYSSNCCYRKVVRHERSVRYVPEGYGYRSGYYDGGYYRRSYRSGYYERPYRYSDYGRHYDGGGYYNTGYYGHDYYPPPNRYYARYRHWTEF